MGNRDFRKEAVKEAVSFLFDNYRFVSYKFDLYPGVDFYKLHHIFNGNTITVRATQKGYTVKKNNEVVKCEP